MIMSKPIVVLSKPIVVLSKPIVVLSMSMFHVVARCSSALSTAAAPTSSRHSTMFRSPFFASIHNGVVPFSVIIRYEGWGGGG